jgi:hypothetical protein
MRSGKVKTPIIIKLLLITTDQEPGLFVRDSADVGSDYGLATDFLYAFEIQNGKCIQATRLDANAISNNGQD